MAWDDTVADAEFGASVAFATMTLAPRGKPCRPSATLDAHSPENPVLVAEGEKG
jgi:hypothetical protein